MLVRQTRHSGFWIRPSAWCRRAVVNGFSYADIATTLGVPKAACTITFPAKASWATPDRAL